MTGQLLSYPLSTHAAVLSITLATGETFSYPVAKMPRNWKSWVMQQLPYGEYSVMGAKYTRTSPQTAAQSA